MTQTTPAPAWNDLPDQLRGWRELDGMSDDARRKLWLMQKAADEIDRLRAAIEAAIGETERGFPGSAFVFLLNAQEGLS